MEQISEEETIPDNKRGDWRAEVKINGSFDLISIKHTTEFDMLKDTFIVRFDCGFVDKVQPVVWNTLEYPMQIVVNIKFNDVPICNVMTQDISEITKEHGIEFISMKTKRLNSFIEIGKAFSHNRSFYFVIFKSNYSELMTVCEKAKNVIKMI